MSETLGLVLGVADVLTDGRVPLAEYEFVVEGDLPRQWRVREFTVEEELSEGYTARVTLERDDDLFESEALLGASATFVMRRPGVVERKFSGIIREVRTAGFTVRGGPVVRVELVPALACLDERVDTYAFQGMTAIEIVGDVLDENFLDYNRSHRVKSIRVDEKPNSRYHLPRREWCVQYHETDGRFVRRLLADEGMPFYFDNTGVREVMVIVDDHVMLPTLNGTVRFTASLGVTPVEECLMSFGVSRCRVPGKVAMTTAALARNQVRRHERVAPPREDPEGGHQPRLGDPGYHEVYDGAAAVVMHGFEADAYRHDNLEFAARLRMEQLISHERVAEGTSTVVAFHAGVFVNLAVPASAEGKYLLTKVVHSGKGHPFIEQGSDAPNYANSFTAIPAKATFRPKPVAPPVARSFDVAVVTSIGEDEIFTDKLGRVQVRFLWDRAADGDRSTEQSSVWIPVAAGWAGSGYGLHILPRKGMVVAVGYLDGNPDRPIVTGCLPVGLNVQPVELPAEKSKLSLRTRSLRKEGSNHYSELSFDDAADRELLFLRAGWNYQRYVVNDDKTDIEKNEVRTVGVNQRIHVKGARDHEVDKNATANFHGKRTIEVDQDDSQTFHGNQTVTFDQGGRTTVVKALDKTTLHADRELDVEGNDRVHIRHDRELTVDGRLTVIQGETRLVLHDNEVQLNAKGPVTIVHGGARFKINEGGSVTVETNKEIKLVADGASITLGGGKAEIVATGEASLAVGGNTVKIDAAGVTTSGNSVTTSTPGQLSLSGAIITANC
jgi:type VI secretion system secreted protein VgrG